MSEENGGVPATASVKSLENFLLQRPMAQSTGRTSIVLPCGHAIREIKRLDERLAAVEAERDRWKREAELSRRFVMYTNIANNTVAAEYRAARAANPTP